MGSEVADPSGSGKSGNPSPEQVVEGEPQPSVLDSWGISEEDATTVVRAVLHGSVAGFTVGGFASAADTAKRHIAENADTRYTSQKEAQRTLNDVVLKEFGRVGARWGWRTGGFLGVMTAGILVGEKQWGEGLVRCYSAPPLPSGWTCVLSFTWKNYCPRVVAKRGGRPVTVARPPPPLPSWANVSPAASTERASLLPA